MNTENNIKNSNNSGNAASKSARRWLIAEFYAFVAAAAATAIAGENDMISLGTAAETDSSQFAALTTMELLTVCLLPLALKMMSIKRIKAAAARKPKNYLLLAAARLAMIGLPMVANALLYYQYMAVAFAYLAIIGALCLSFVYPGKGRIEEILR